MPQHEPLSMEEVNKQLCEIELQLNDLADRVRPHRIKLAIVLLRISQLVFNTRLAIRGKE